MADLTQPWSKNFDPNPSLAESNSPRKKQYFNRLNLQKLQNGKIMFVNKGRITFATCFEH